MHQQIFTVEFIWAAALLGVGATAFIDLWALSLRHCLGVTSLDFRYFGRWVGHLRYGVLHHRNITQSAPVNGEQIIGWGLHYAIGVVFAAVLLLVTGPDWLVRPNVLPALWLGALTVVFPYFILQPCLGAGVAARLTPQPQRARLKSLLTHLMFGVGLYVSARLFYTLELLP